RRATRPEGKRRGDHYGPVPPGSFGLVTHGRSAAGSDFQRTGVGVTAKPYGPAPSEFSQPRGCRKAACGTARGQGNETIRPGFPTSLGLVTHHTHVERGLQTTLIHFP